MAKRVFVLYDGRARGGDTDDATVFCTAHSEAECRRHAKDHGDDAIWYEYDLVNNEAINEKMRLDLSAKQKMKTGKRVSDER